MSIRDILRDEEIESMSVVVVVRTRAGRTVTFDVPRLNVDPTSAAMLGEDHQPLHGLVLGYDADYDDPSWPPPRMDRAPTEERTSLFIRGAHPLGADPVYTITVSSPGVPVEEVPS